MRPREVPIIELARPKVNLTLRVLGKRPDGFHELESLVVFARDIADQITLTLPRRLHLPHRSAPTRRVTCGGPYGATIAGVNLIEVALDHIARAAPALILGDVALEKNLPVAAGIGGGSADAAAVIRAVMRANPDHADLIDWHGIAARIGADVPVCLRSTAQIMRATGNLLAPAPGLPALAAVLVNPMAPVPADKTAQVFRRLAAAPVPVQAAARGTGARGTPGAFHDRGELLHHMAAAGNDLTAPARTIVPAIDAVLGALRVEAACELAQLSGGGPTCFGIFTGMATARSAAASIAARHPHWWVQATRLD